MKILFTPSIMLKLAGVFLFTGLVLGVLLSH